MLKTDKTYAQITRKAKAAMYPDVTEADVISIVTPEVSSSETSQIEENMQEADDLSLQSRHLLNEFRQQGEFSITSSTSQK